MVRHYVGARYVPKLASPVEWAADTSYEALTIVTFNNASYTSKVPVPPTVGDPADNPDYWALTGNYNAQVEQYRQETETVSNNLTTLQGQMTTEITNRETADATLQDQISAERTERSQQDAVLSARMDSFSRLPDGSLSTAADAELKDIRVMADGKTASTAGDAVREQFTELKSDLDAVVTEIASKNIFDTSNKTVGKYLNPNSGTYASNDGFSTTDYIPVLGSENYMFAYDNDRTANTEPYYFYCWYDESKTHISGGMHTGAATTITSPENAKYIRLSYSNSFESYIQFERGDTQTGFVAHQANAIKIRKNAHYTVVSGTPSTTLLELCEIARNATEDNPYIVELAEGTYNALDGYTNSAKTAAGFKGLTVPNYTTIKGTGKKENTIIQCILSTKDQNISTLNLAGTASLENLTIVGEKTRYAIHDDFSYSDGKCYRSVVNCDIIVTDAYYGSAYGSGVRSGARWYFKDTLFQSNNGEAFTIHSNVGFDNYADVTLENCTVKTKARVGVRIGAMQSGALNRIHFIGCTLSGIRVMEEQHDACGVDWIVDGHGNTPNILWSYVYTDGGEYYPEFSDETVYLKCAAAINKNDPVYRDAENVVKVQSNRKAFIGVALKTGAAGDIIPIKTKGNVCIDDWSIASGVAKTDYMSLNNGAFVVDNTISDPIGIISNTTGFKEMLLCGLQNR